MTYQYSLEIFKVVRNIMSFFIHAMITLVREFKALMVIYLPAAREVMSSDSIPQSLYPWGFQFNYEVKFEIFSDHCHAQLSLTLLS